MDYRRFGDTIVARLDKGEEILEQVRAIAQQEHIQLASIHALGAIDDLTVGVFNTATKTYAANHFTGAYEIVSLTGTISTMNGEFYAHLHMSAGGEDGTVFGGHLNAATISATCEMVINVIDGQVDRAFSQEIGLNLLRF